MIVGGIIFISTLGDWLQKISITWFNFNNKNDLNVLLAFLVCIIPFAIMVIGIIRANFKLRCPHCNKPLTESLSLNLAIGAQRCRFCGKEVFSETPPNSHSRSDLEVSHEAEPLGRVSLDPAFPNREEFQKIRPSRYHKRLPRISFLCLLITALLTPFVLSIIMTKELIHFHLLHSPEVVVAFFVLNLLGLSYLEGMIFPPILKKLESETPLCPNCKMSLRNGSSATILFTTGNCCYCGKKLWGENDFTESQRNPAIGQSNKDHEVLHPFHETISRIKEQEKTAITECYLVFAILCIIFPMLIKYLAPHVSNQTYARIILSSIVLFLIACFYYVRRSAPKMRCPHCKKDIGERTSIAVVVATGNCCLCGKPLADNLNLSNQD
jgi:NADH:ubiquinone oxidoreductase subunit 3 (subunit A)